MDLKSDMRTITGLGQNAAPMVATPSASFSTKKARGLAWPRAADSTAFFSSPSTFG
ncbi:Uncharacterised protein [Bordetella pertussis]|nr:Uncharacterised protein [Bordetella pertussis]